MDNVYTSEMHVHDLDLGFRAKAEKKTDSYLEFFGLVSGVFFFFVCVFCLVDVDVSWTGNFTGNSD